MREEEEGDFGKKSKEKILVEGCLKIEQVEKVK